MATASRANPIPSEQVIIDDDSVAYGYPVDPQPLPSAATVDPEYSEKCKARCFAVIFSLVFWLAIAGISYLIDSKKKLPRFQLDSVSLNVVNTTTTVWDIVFSIDKNVGDLDVWVRFMARDYKIESVSRTVGNVTESVSALLPQEGFDYSSGLIRVEQVMFRCSNYEKYLLEAACKDVAVGFSSKNETSTPTRGVMQGGPRVCPVVNHKHI